MVNGKDLWGIVHTLMYPFEGTLRTECNKRDPMRATDEPVDCAYCVTEVERRKAIREKRAAREAELEQLRLTDTAAYMKEWEKFRQSGGANF